MFRKRAQLALVASLGTGGADQFHVPGSSVERLRHVWGGFDSQSESCDSAISSRHPVMPYFFV